MARMTSALHRLLGAGALAAGAVTLGFAAGGVAAVDDDLVAATRPAPPVRDALVEYRPVTRPECSERLPLRLGREL